MDNVRNMTGSPIAGIDPHEFLDVRRLNKGEPNPMSHELVYTLPTCFACLLTGSCSLLTDGFDVIACIISSMNCRFRGENSLTFSLFSVSSSCLCSVALWSFALHPSRPATALPLCCCLPYAPCCRHLKQQLLSCLCRHALLLRPGDESVLLCCTSASTVP